MKRLSAFALLTLLSCVQLFAQPVQDSLRYAESLWSMEKKALVLKEMKLTEAEKSAFWPVYESYSNAIQYLEMEYIRMLNMKDDNLSDKKAGSLTEHMLINELLLAKIRKQYFRKFRKALGPAHASRFMQLDDDFRTVLRTHMQKVPPSLITSLDRSPLRD